MVFCCRYTCLLVAFGIGIQCLGMLLTAGDGMFDPPRACDATCQEGWRQLGHHGELWMVGALVTLAFALGLGLTAVRQERRNRTKQARGNV
jgi:hypothetical protein